MNNFFKKILNVGLFIFISTNSFGYDSSYFISNEIVAAPSDSVQILNHLIEINNIDYRSIPLSNEQLNTLRSMADINHATSSLNIIPEILKKIDTFHWKIKKLSYVFGQFYSVHDYVYGKLPKTLYIDTAQEVKKYDGKIFIYPIIADLLRQILDDDYDHNLDSTIVDLLQLKDPQYSLMLLATVNARLEKEDTLRIIGKFRSSYSLSENEKERLGKIINRIKNPVEKRHKTIY
jgi:hypothetical protein